MLYNYWVFYASATFATFGAGGRLREPAAERPAVGAGPAALVALAGLRRPHAGGERRAVSLRAQLWAWAGIAGASSGCSR